MFADLHFKTRINSNGLHVSELPGSCFFSVYLSCSKFERKHEMFPVLKILLLLLKQMQLSIPM